MKIKKFTLILIVLLIASLSVMCTGDQQPQQPQKPQQPQQTQKTPLETPERAGDESMEETNRGETQPKLSIFYYYHPLCPNCQKIKPYMDLMMNVTEIDACNVGNISACSPESIEMLKFLKSRGKFVGVPTIAVLEGRNVTLLIGWKQALKLGELVEAYGITPSPVTYNNTYTVQECVECHSARGLTPPSTFSCTYCCHTGDQPEKANTG